MQILHAWKESLMMLLPAQGKQFFMVTLKTIVETAKTWLANFWWLAAAYIMIDGISLYLYKYTLSIGTLDALAEYKWAFSALEYANLVCSVLMLWTLLLTVRPSVKRKVMSYYFEYRKQAVCFLVTLGVLYFIISQFLDPYFAQLIYFRAMGLPLSTFNLVIYYILNYVTMAIIPMGAYLGAAISLVYAPIFILSTFALLDARPSFKDMTVAKFRSLGIVAYAYPLLWVIAFLATLAVSGATYLSVRLISYILSVVTSFPFFVLWMLDVAFFVVGSCIYVCYVSLLSNIYVKSVHDQFKPIK